MQNSASEHARTRTWQERAQSVAMEVIDEGMTMGAINRPEVCAAYIGGVPDLDLAQRSLRSVGICLAPTSVGSRACVCVRFVANHRAHAVLSVSADDKGAAIGAATCLDVLGSVFRLTAGF